MSLISCEINFILAWSSTCLIKNSTYTRTFAIADTKHYIPVVTLSTQGNGKLLENVKSNFKRAINWNKYQSKVSKQRKNQYLAYLVNSRLSGSKQVFYFVIRR